MQAELFLLAAMGINRNMQSETSGTLVRTADDVYTAIKHISFDQCLPS